MESEEEKIKDEDVKEVNELTLFERSKQFTKEHKGIIALGLTTSVLLIPVFFVAKKFFYRRKKS